MDDNSSSLAIEDRGPWLGSDPRSLAATATSSDDTPWYLSRNVKRDATRGVDKLSRKEQRDIEDAACDAGMRNRATVLGRWPSLVAAMAPVRTALLKAISKDPELHDLPFAVGKSPANNPPSFGFHHESKATGRTYLGVVPRTRGSQACSRKGAAQHREGNPAEMQFPRLSITGLAR